MSQDEIFEILKKQPDKFFSSDDFAKLTGVTSSNCCRAACKLADEGLVYRKVVRGSHNFKYVFKLSVV